MIHSGKDVVDAFFLIAAGVDDSNYIGKSVNPETRRSVMRVKEALMSKKMLDESLLQQKKEVYLKYLEKEARDVPVAKDSEIPSESSDWQILDTIQRFPVTSLSIAAATLTISALAIGYLSIGRAHV